MNLTKEQSFFNVNNFSEFLHVKIKTFAKLIGEYFCSYF